MGPDHAVPMSEMAAVPSVAISPAGAAIIAVAVPPGAHAVIAVAAVDPPRRVAIAVIGTIRVGRIEPAIAIGIGRIAVTAIIGRVAAVISISRRSDRRSDHRSGQQACADADPPAAAMPPAIADLNRVLIFGSRLGCG